MFWKVGLSPVSAGSPSGDGKGSPRICLLAKSHHVPESVRGAEKIRGFNPAIVRFSPAKSFIHNIQTLALGTRLSQSQQLVLKHARRVISGSREYKSIQGKATGGRPGNPEKVRSGLRDWKLGRCLFVADAGMNSEENRELLTKGCGKYLLAARAASVKEVREEVLTRPGRFKKIAENLHIKEVRSETVSFAAGISFASIPRRQRDRRPIERRLSLS
jgi:hypothetical protein